jgi:SAM-dependent methyltransferase
MAPSKHSRAKENNTYFIAEHSHKRELARLIAQDQILTRGMGGVLPELSDRASLRCVLDVGCGTGGWLCQTAQTHATVTRLVGVDISQKVVAYARAQALSQGLADRMEFSVMDVLRELTFPEMTFDLVNMRQGGSFLRTWDWPPLLQELLRVTRHNGVLRIVETDLVSESNSPAFNQLSAWLVSAFHASGHYFKAEQNGLIDELFRLLSQVGLSDIQTQAYSIEYRADTPDGQLFIEDMRYVLASMQSFVQKWVRISSYEEVLRQAMEDLSRPDFVARWGVFTAWGKKA